MPASETGPFHPRSHARLTPEKPAVVMADSGAVLTYAELDAAADRGARFLRAQGVARGEVIAILMENSIAFYEAAWAAERCGIRYVCVSTQLTAPEVAYILSDSGAKLFIASDKFEEIAREAAGLAGGVRMAHARAFAAHAGEGPIDDEAPGADMLYSSGTTGRPKGIRAEMPEGPLGQLEGLVGLMQAIGMGAHSRYLCPAPLYHAAPLRWSMRLHKLGGTVVLMEKFDAEGALAAIARHKTDCAQWVPTHFVRMLKLPPEVRTRYDLSSQTLAVHAAAPCPPEVKREMIGWWGPILFEYYAGSEGNGLTAITSPDWLEHPGSVGKAVIGTVHICDDDANELPPETEGIVYFEGGAKFTYHNDPEKTANAANRHGWTTLGDIGRLDKDGYLYLADRRDFMIISGGVNIYPREIEDRLIGHPAVRDVAVFGLPDEEMGQRVMAVVEPADAATAGAELAAELIAWARQGLSGPKTPRKIDFIDALPRHPNGKLYKRLLRDQYMGKTGVRMTD